MSSQIRAMGVVRAGGRAVLASDSIDVIVGTAAIPKVGAGGGLVAALLPVPFVLADVWALRST